MNYLKTDYYAFIGQAINETTSTLKSSPVDYAKIYCLRSQMSSYRKKLGDEKDPDKKRKLQMQIKICELKIMIAQIK